MASLIQVRDLLALQGRMWRRNSWSLSFPYAAAGDDRRHAGKTEAMGKAVRIQEEPDGCLSAAVNFARRKSSPQGGVVGNARIKADSAEQNSPGCEINGACAALATTIDWLSVIVIQQWNHLTRNSPSR